MCTCNAQTHSTITASHNEKSKRTQLNLAWFESRQLVTVHSNVPSTYCSPAQTSVPSSDSIHNRLSDCCADQTSAADRRPAQSVEHISRQRQLNTICAIREQTNKKSCSFPPFLQDAHLKTQTEIHATNRTASLIVQKQKKKTDIYIYIHKIYFGPLFALPALECAVLAQQLQLQQEKEL